MIDPCTVGQYPVDRLHQVGLVVIDEKSIPVNAEWKKT